MFDVGFLELLLIGIVALLVLGPERLPRVARAAGKWIGRGRRFISSVRSDIDRELKADELREILEKQRKNNPLHDIVEDSKNQIAQMKGDAEAAFDIRDKSIAEKKDE